LPSEPLWLTAELLIRLNARIVADTGEPHFIRDMGLLESALARPVNRWHYGEGDMVVLAATLLLGIARNHPFAQGNKRTAFEASDAFLYLNGYELDLPDGAAAADLIVDVMTGTDGEDALIALFGEGLKPLEG
jgi:death-on-curing protein